MTAEWIKYHAFYSNKSRSWPYLRVFFDTFDIRPNLLRSKLRNTKQRIKQGLPAIGHIHTPKTGGTYTQQLRQVLPHVNFSHVVVRNDRSDKYCPVGLTAISPAKIEGYFLFSSVRNPLNFFISYYHHVKGFEKYRNPYHYDYDAARRGFDYLLQTIMNRTDKWPSRKFLFPQLFDQSGNCIIHWINRTETLDSDLKRLCARFDLKWLPHEPQRVSPKRQLPQDYYSGAVYNEALNVYSREMNMFGYDEFTLKEMPHTGNADLPLKYDFVHDAFI